MTNVFTHTTRPSEQLGMLTVIFRPTDLEPLLSSLIIRYTSVSDLGALIFAAPR